VVPLADVSRRPVEPGELTGVNMDGHSLRSGQAVVVAMSGRLSNFFRFRNACNRTSRTVGAEPSLH
jgi:hypothetical protein